MRTRPWFRRAGAAALAAGFLVISAGAAAPVQAAPSSLSESPSSSDGQGPQFFSGGLIHVQKDVEGDVYAAGQSVTIDGDIAGDVIAAGQNITINGDVDGDLRLAGQNIRINGVVTRSGTVLGADVQLSEEGSFGGDLVGSAETAVIDGSIGRDLILSVGDLSVDGAVGGDLTYYSDDEALISPEAVEGSTERFAPSRSAEVEVSPGTLFLGWILGLLYALIALSPIAVIASLLFPRTVSRVTDHLVHSPWKTLLTGFVASLTVPLVLLFLLITVVGAPLAFAGLLVWSVLTLASFVYSAFFLGRLVLRGEQRPAVKALIGALILIAGLATPWLNVLVWIAMVLLGLGAQLLDFYDRAPWRRRGEIGAVAQRPREEGRVGDEPTDR